MQNRRFNTAPIALTTTLTTNVLNSAITSTAGPVGFTMPQPYIIISHFRVTNKTSAAATFTLYKGGTGGNVAGTELAVAQSVSANSSYDYYGQFRLDSTDFVVGGAGTTLALVIWFEGEIGVAG